MQKKHQKILKAIFTNPISANIKFKDIESLFEALGADISEREGSRIAIVLDGQVKVFHRPHPSPNTDKGEVVSVRKWLESLGYNLATLNPTDVPSENEETDDE